MVMMGELMKHGVATYDEELLLLADCCVVYGPSVLAKLRPLFAPAYSLADGFALLKFSA